MAGWAPFFAHRFHISPEQLGDMSIAQIATFLSYWRTTHPGGDSG